jgi:hypothetical protein
MDRAHLHIRRELRRLSKLEMHYPSGHDAAKVLNILLQKVRRSGMPQRKKSNGKRASRSSEESHE